MRPMQRRPLPSRPECHPLDANLLVLPPGNGLPSRSDSRGHHSEAGLVAPHKQVLSQLLVMTYHLLLLLPAYYLPLTSGASQAGRLISTSVSTAGTPADAWAAAARDVVPASHSRAPSARKAFPSCQHAPLVRYLLPLVPRVQGKPPLHANTRPVYAPCCH